jgi:hypothetical protein
VLLTLSGTVSFKLSQIVTYPYPTYLFKTRRSGNWIPPTEAETNSIYREELSRFLLKPQNQFWKKKEEKDG